MNYDDYTAGRFVCQECGAEFKKPIQKRYHQNHGEFVEVWYEWYCPICGSDKVREDD